MRKLKVLIWGIFLWAITLNAQAIEFDAARGYYLQFPISLTSVDFDKDGDMDLAALGYDRIYILTNDGKGIFASSAEYTVKDYSHSITSSDFDGDGDTDLVTSHYVRDLISILKNNGDGTFAEPIYYNAGNNPEFIVASDLDNDNDIDLAVTNDSDHFVSVLKNDGEGTFSLFASYTVGNYPNAISAADFDNDNDMDLATTNSDDISILFNNGDGSFSPVVSYPSAADEPDSIATGDLDKDGDADLIARDDKYVSIFFNDGTGVFSTPVNYNVGTGYEGIVVSDFDKDQDLDLAVNATNYNQYDPSPENLFILMNNGDGTFADPIGYVGHRGFVGNSSLITSDFNNDGMSDIVGSNSYPYGGSYIFILTNKGDGIFPSPEFYDPGNNATRSCVIVDLDKNGVSDLAIGGYWGIQIIKRYRDGTLSSPPLVYDIDGGASYLCVLDYDRDGDSDLALSNDVYPNNYLVILENNGYGSFYAPIKFQIENEPYYIASGDFNTDGYPDLAIANYEASSVSIFVNNKDKTFQAVGTYITGIEPTSLAISDLELDGDLDIVVANKGSGTISVLYNDGNASFSINDISSGDVYSIITADLNSDKYPDLATSEGDTYYPDQNIQVWLNEGNGTFSSGVIYDTHTSSQSIIASDLDKDDDFDLISADDRGNISILENKGDATFETVVYYMTNGHPLDVDTVDLDNDDDPDLVVMDPSKEGIYLLKNLLLNPPTEEWKTISGPWSDEEGEFGLHDDSTEQAEAEYTKGNFVNFALTLNIKPISTSNPDDDFNYAVKFRYVDDSDYYTLNISKDKLSLIKRGGIKLFKPFDIPIKSKVAFKDRLYGNITPKIIKGIPISLSLAEVERELPLDGQWHTYQIIADGENIKVYEDNQLMLDTKDKGGSGKIRIATNYTHAHFDLVSIKDISELSAILSDSWQHFKDYKISTQGQVWADDDSSNDKVVSESQALAMLRSVWMKDQTTFDLVWNWTKQNLQRKNITQVYDWDNNQWVSMQESFAHKIDNLFAWRWVKNVDGTGIDGIVYDGGSYRQSDGLDSASDADEEIALALILADKLVKQDKWQAGIDYGAEAQAIISDIWNKEVFSIPSLSPMLDDFENGIDRWWPYAQNGSKMALSSVNGYEGNAIRADYTTAIYGSWSGCGMGLDLHGRDGSYYEGISFWIRGYDPQGKGLNFKIYDSQHSYSITVNPSSQWSYVEIPYPTGFDPAYIDQIEFQPRAYSYGTPLTGYFELDNVGFYGGTPPTDTTFYLSAGDNYTSVNGMNPSYLGANIYRLLEEFDVQSKTNGSNHNWAFDSNGIAASTYAVLEANGVHNFDSTTGAAASSYKRTPSNWIDLGWDGEIKPSEYMGSQHIHFNITTWDAFRALWRVAADYDWNKDTQASQYLTGENGPIQLLVDELATYGEILMEYYHNGTRYPSGKPQPASYGAYLAFMDEANHILSGQYREDVEEILSLLLATYNNGFWGNNEYEYYSQNWAWFGLALYAEKIKFE